MSDETKPDPSAIKWRTVHADSYGRAMLDRVQVPEGCFYCVYDEPGGKIVGASFCPSPLPALVAEVERLRSELASCYRITGADPDGNDDAMLATKAVAAVRRLRASADHEGEKSEEWERCYRALQAAAKEWFDHSLCYCPTTRCEIESRLRALLAKGGAA